MSALAAPPLSPFKGLAAFDDSELDALFFFGREHEREIVVANMLASRLTILYGESGVGKSSLLGAAVVRDLREEAPDATVVLHDRWSGSLEGVTADVAAAAEAYLILDQFEEYFLYHGDDEGSGTLLDELPELLSRSRVNVLVSLREDTLSRLDAFKARIPQVFANQLRLEHLDRESARAAILGPIGRWNDLTGEAVEIEPALVDAVLDEVAVEGRSHDVDRIEAPYLQLVLERLWETERAAGSAFLRFETLRRLGGAKTIVRDHLLRALAAMPGEQQDVAASMFEHLVTPSGTKIAHRAPDLAQYANVPESALRGVLSTLSDDRIVHSVDGSDRYEIFHDVLAEPISAWRLQRRLERERVAARRRQQRLGAVAVVALIALGVVGALAVWAFSERGHARRQAHHARARALESRSLEQLTLDPRKSVRLGLAAAQLEPSGTAEAVLRQALIQDRLRVTVHVNGKVGAVAISPSGRLLATSGPAGVVVADARTGRVLRTLRTRGNVAALGFTHGGDALVAGSVLRATRWDVQTWRPASTPGRFAAALGPHGISTFPLRGAFARAAPHVYRLAVTGTLAAAAVTEPNGHVRVRIFDRRGRLLHVLPELGVTALGFSPDGRMLAASRFDGSTWLWNPRAAKPIRLLRDPETRPGKPGKRVESVAFSPDGTLLALGGQDSGVRIWSVAEGIRLYLLIGHTNPVAALAWSPDGRVVASASLDRTIRLWRAQNIIAAGSVTAALAGHRDVVRALAYSTDGTRLVTGSDDGTARVWDARPDQELRVLSRRRGSVLTARWAGTSVVAAWEDGVVRVIDPQRRRILRELRRRQPLTALAVSADGAVAAAGGGDGKTAVWNLRSGKEFDTVGGSDAVRAVAVSPSGDVAASGDARGIVRVWNAQSGRILWSAAQQGGQVADVAFSPDGRRLVTASPTGAVIWSVASNRPLRRLPVRGGVARVTFSPYGAYVATADNDGTARLWFADTGRAYRVYRGHSAPLTDVSFSSDGALLATSSHDADGRIWNVATGRSVHVLRGHFGSVAAIGFNRDRRWIVTAGPISAGVWPMSTGQLLMYLRGHSQLLTSVSFSPDGHTILSSSLDGTVRTFSCAVCVDLGGLERLAEQRLALGR